MEPCDVSQKYNFMLPYMERVQEIISPFLQSYNLGHFWYSRFYEDSSFIDLGNCPDWFEHVLSHDYYNFRFDTCYWPCDEMMLISTPRDFSAALSLETIDFLVKKYNLFYLFNLIIKRDDYRENFGFSAPIDHYGALSLYSRYYGILKAFGVSFSQQYTTLIQTVESQGKILLSSSQSHFPYDIQRRESLSSFHLLHQNNVQVQDKFIYPLKHYFIKTSRGDVKITSRQRQCLALLARGYNLKQAAACLQIAPKTLEAHLLRLKDKTGLSRLALLQTYLQSGL